MKNYFEKNDKKCFKKNEEENFESMDSTFTPIGRGDFKKLKIEEIEDLKNRSLKKSKIEEVKD
jgi:hypothetical protein